MNGKIQFWRVWMECRICDRTLHVISFVENHPQCYEEYACPCGRVTKVIPIDARHTFGAWMFAQFLSIFF